MLMSKQADISVSHDKDTYLNTDQYRAVNLVKPKIGRFRDPKIGRNSKHFHDNRRHINEEFCTILTQLYDLIVLTTSTKIPQ